VLGAPPLSERLLGAKYLKLTHREDLTHTLADVAKRHCAARVHHSAELRALGGDNLFDMFTTYRAVAERLAREGRLAHVLFVAQSQLSLEVKEP